MSSLLGGRAAYLVCRKAAVESFAEVGEQLCLVWFQNRGVVTLILAFTIRLLQTWVSECQSH